MCICVCNQQPSYASDECMCLSDVCKSALSLADSGPLHLCSLALLDFECHDCHTGHGKAAVSHTTRSAGHWQCLQGLWRVCMDGRAADVTCLMIVHRRCSAILGLLLRCVAVTVACDCEQLHHGRTSADAHACNHHSTKRTRARRTKKTDRHQRLSFYVNQAPRMILHSLFAARHGLSTLPHNKVSASSCNLG